MENNRQTTRAGAGDSFSVADGECPSKLEGQLLKKSPNPFRLRQYQQRHVVVETGILSWSATNGMMVRGQVDFGKNNCEVRELKESEGAFEIRPLEKGWVDADFTGVESGRTLIFDATGFDYPRNKWIEVIRAHIAYAQKYGSSSPATSSSALPHQNKKLFHLDVLNMEDEGGGAFPLKEQWDLRITKPPVPDRTTWKGVFCNAPKELVEDLAGNAKFRHPAVPLTPRPGQPDPSTAPHGLEESALRHVMEFINYFFTLQGRPSCWYGGEGKASPEVCDNRDTRSGIFAGHFENKNCFACPQAGTGSIYDLMRNCWTTQARMVQGDETWMTPSINSSTNLIGPMGLQCQEMPPRSLRGNLLKDPEFVRGISDVKTLASKLYHNGHGPYVIFYKQPTSIDDDEKHSDERVVPGNTSRVFVYPPPGMIIKGGFQEEPIGEKTLGRKGLPGEDKMGQSPQVAEKGSTLGGPVVKVHFVSDDDMAKYQGAVSVKLVDLDTGTDVPVWISDAKANKGEEHYHAELQEAMASRAVLWVIPKPILSMNRMYQASAKLKMKDEDPIELVWSFTTFGPRVFDIPSPLPEDATQSLDWALETVADMKMKPLLRADGKTVPSVICVKAGEYHIKARFIDPGPWLHIEGAGSEDTTIVIEAPDPVETFDFPSELELGDKGKSTGYEFGWQNKNVPVFNMIHFHPSEHNGGGADPGAWSNSPRLVTMCGVTVKINVPLALGEHGFMELVDCHIVSPWDAALNRPQINHPKSGPKLRISDCTYQRNDLFQCADLNSDGYIDKQEFQTLLKKEAGIEQAEAETYFNEFDFDQSGKLERQEFEQAYHAVILKKNKLGSWQGIGDGDDEEWSP